MAVDIPPSWRLLTQALLKPDGFSYEAVPISPYLAWNWNKGPLYFEFDVAADLDRFLREARMVAYDPDENRIAPLHATSLGALLWEGLERVTPRRRIFRHELQAEPCTFIGRRKDQLTASAKTALATSQSFYGQFAVCSCGTPGCSAEYVWMEQSVALLYIRIVGAGIRYLEFFPFELCQ